MTVCPGLGAAACQAHPDSATAHRVALGKLLLVLGLVCFTLCCQCGPLGALLTQVLNGDPALLWRPCLLGQVSVQGAAVSPKLPQNWGTLQQESPRS